MPIARAAATTKKWENAPEWDGPPFVFATHVTSGPTGTPTINAVKEGATHD